MGNILTMSMSTRNPNQVGSQTNTSQTQTQNQLIQGLLIVLIIAFITQYKPRIG